MKKIHYVWVAILAALAFIAPLLMYVSVFFHGLSRDAENWGRFGEYLSGTTGVLLTALGFGAVLITIALEQLRVKEREHEVQKHRLEERLYRLLDTLSEILSGVELRLKPGQSRAGGALRAAFIISRGKAAFRNFYLKKLRAIYRKHKIQYRHNPVPERELVEAAFDELYRRYGSNFGHYFRTLYHCFMVIENDIISDEEKKLYVSLIVCRLSKFELLMLMYNCLGSIGGRKFKPLVEKYGLLEHLDQDFVLKPEHLSFFMGSAFE